MGTVKNLVITKQVRYLCDKCRNELDSCDHVLTVNPPIFVYTCKNCGAKYSLPHSYPYIEYEEIK